MDDAHQAPTDPVAADVSRRSMRLSPARSIHPCAVASQSGGGTLIASSEMRTAQKPPPPAEEVVATLTGFCEAPVMPISMRSRWGKNSLLAFGAAAGLLLFSLTGCVGVHEQRLLSKPNMQFSRFAVFSYSSKTMPQIQPGLAATGQAKASTCTACN